MGNVNARVYFPRGAREFVADDDGLIAIKRGAQIVVENEGEIILQDGAQVVVGDNAIITTAGGGSVPVNITEETPVTGLKAALTTTLGVANAELKFTAKTRGEGGNDIEIEYVDPEEANAAVSVEVEGNLITVTLVPGNGAPITTTANDIVTAMVANELVTVDKAGGNDGTGVVTAMVATALTGGRDATAAKKGDLRFDGTNFYIATDDIEATDTGTAWHKVAHAAIS